jgi:serine/threonine-protein kinase
VDRGQQPYRHRDRARHPGLHGPEQLAGAEPDARGDLYALGAMAFELLAGRLPHEAATMGELLRRVAQDPVPDLAQWCPGITPALSALVARLLTRERTARPDDALAVAAACAALRRGGSPSR